MNCRFLAIIFLATVLFGLPNVGTGQVAVDGYQVKPGDILNVSVWGEEELQGAVLVAPDGTISFPLVGHVDAKGQTTAALQEIITIQLKRYISDPVVSISISEVNGNKIYVIGQVKSPGAFVMNPALDVMQALSVAGGTTPFAKLDDIAILRRNQATQEVLRFRYSDVSRGRNLNQNIQLQSGDVVVVP